MKRVLVALVAASCLLGPRAGQAQTPVADDRMEFFGSGGLAWFGHGRIDWAEGAELGGGVTLLPFTGPLRRLGIQASGAFLNEDEHTAGAATETVNASQFVAAATWHFTRSRVQPYALGGLAVIRAERTWACDTCSDVFDQATGRVVPQTLREHVNATEAGVVFGGGLRVLVGRRLAARVEATVADTTPGGGWNWNWRGVRAGLGVRF